MQEGRVGKERGEMGREWEKTGVGRGEVGLGVGGRWR